MLISIIAIFYNSEQYLRQCLESVINQKNVEMEIVAVDDCSSDATLAILDEYSKISPNIKIIKHESNKGIAEARNSGLKNMTGDCFFLIDGDDMLASGDALYELSKNFSEDIDFVQGTYNVMDESGHKIKAISFIDNKYESKQEICENFDKLNLIYTHNKLFNKKYKNQLFESGVYHEDRIFNAKIFPDLQSVITISYPTYNYIVHNSNTSSTSRSTRNYIESGLMYLDIIKKYPPCWKDIRSTFQIVDIEKPLYLWGKNSKFRKEVLKHVYDKEVGNFEINSFPRFTQLIHKMIYRNYPDVIINVISKTYTKVMKTLNKPV